MGRRNRATTSSKAASDRGAADGGGPGAEKPCTGCGRRIEWRRKWARNWAEVRYCSNACRSRGVRSVDAQLEGAILDLLAARAGGATICPSEAARRVAGSEADESAWRDLMEPARQAARRLVIAGRVEITQGGRVVDPSTAKGPIRVRATSARALDEGRSRRR